MLSCSHVVIHEVYFLNVCSSLLHTFSPFLAVIWDASTLILPCMLWDQSMGYSDCFCIGEQFSYVCML